ncbi:MAG TPA: BolA/IbaG family iron-sulfur metabolism protein [Planctomycetota bacterium]
MSLPRDQVEAAVAAAIPGARVAATDLTGTQDHWQVRVVWDGFEGMPLLAQHRRVMAALQPHLEGSGSGAIHAVQLQTVATETT